MRLNVLLLSFRRVGQSEMNCSTRLSNCNCIYENRAHETSVPTRAEVFHLKVLEELDRGRIDDLSFYMCVLFMESIRAPV